MSKTVIGSAVCWDFESEGPVAEKNQEMLDCVVSAANSSVLRCALKVVMSATSKPSLMAVVTLANISITCTEGGIWHRQGHVPLSVNKICLVWNVVRSNYWIPNSPVMVHSTHHPTLPTIHPTTTVCWHVDTAMSLEATAHQFPTGFGMEWCRWN